MELNNKSRILVVAAHPDDEVLGCGATLAKALHNGADVSVLFLGEGVSARFPVGEYESDEFNAQTKIRKEGALKALNILKIKQVAFSERLCGQFDTYPIISIVKEIEVYLEEYKPTILLTHNPTDVNIDHYITYKAVEIACRPTREWIPKSIYTFEIACSGSWIFDKSFKPNVFVNVNNFWDKKMEAWKCYQGEARDFPFPRSDIGLETLAQYRGMASNLKKVEAFCLVRKIIE